MNYCERCEHHHPCASCGQKDGPSCGECPCSFSQHKELSENADVDENGDITLFYHWAPGSSGILRDVTFLETAVYREEPPLYKAYAI